MDFLEVHEILINIHTTNHSGLPHMYRPRKQPPKNGRENAKMKLLAIAT